MREGPRAVRFVRRAVEILREEGVHVLAGAVARNVRKLGARARYVWRTRHSTSPELATARLAILTVRFSKGYGVDVVVAEQLQYFLGRGYRVTLLVLEHDEYFTGRFSPYVKTGQLELRRVRGEQEATAWLLEHRPHAVIAHTPPFFGCLARLPDSIFRVFYDHGEPPAEWFEDRDERRRTHAEKIRVSEKVDLAVSISDFIRRDSRLHRAVVNWQGNDHLLERRDDLPRLAGGFRSRLGVGPEDFLVLNVTRFFAAERRYKGVDLYARVKEALCVSHPELADKVKFVLAGRCEEADAEQARTQGLLPCPNLTDDELVGAYLDSDFYLSTSQWEGFNLGLAQALSFGLPAAASAMGAHPEFGIPVSNSPEQLAEELARAYQAATGSAGRPGWKQRLASSRLMPWRDSLQRLEHLMLTRALRTPGASGHVTGLTPKLQELERVLARDRTRPRLSFLILTKNKPELLIPCVRSIEAQCTVPYEILIGDTGSTDPAVLAFYQNIPHAVFPLGFYNFSACNNLLAARASGEYLVLINNDVELIHTDFAAALDTFASQPRTGTIGAYLVYKDERLQHAGVRICPDEPYRGIPEHIDKHQPLAGYPGLAAPREVVCVTGALLLISAERYRRMGGLDERFVEEAQDADLGLKILQEGGTNIVHPALVAYHHENATRTVKESPHDRELFTRRHGVFIEDFVYQWQADRGLAPTRLAGKPSP
ncbi:GT2 family glycosyltransferase [Archangium gephyra]|uniref:GT2 family glycosyltransferase n=1 Tax=Archangium gephyra TaxID=48 RepID=A0ABX9JNU5_9BACT|nr:GT2 family glycosyltransferase [Archangium gephyra]